MDLFLHIEENMRRLYIWYDVFIKTVSKGSVEQKPCHLPVFLLFRPGGVRLELSKLRCLGFLVQHSWLFDISSVVCTGRETTVRSLYRWAQGKGSCKQRLFKAHAKHWALDAKATAWTINMCDIIFIMQRENQMFLFLSWWLVRGRFTT